MSTFWAAVIAYLIGNAAGIIEMAILSGWLDKQLDRRQKKKGR